MIGCTRVRKQPIIALCYAFENELSFLTFGPGTVEGFMSGSLLSVKPGPLSFKEETIIINSKWVYSRHTDCRITYML